MPPAKTKKVVSKKKGSKPIKFRLYKLDKPRLLLLLDRAILLVLGLTVFTIPLIYSIDYYYSFEFPKITWFYICTTVLTTLFLFKVLLSGKRELVQSPILSTLMMFLLAYVFASIFSLSPITSITGQYGMWTLSLISIICFTLIAIVTANTVKSPDSRSRIAWYIAISSLTSALGGIVLRFTDESGTFVINGAATSTQGHPVYLGMFLIFGLVSCVALLLDSRHWLVRSLLSLGTIVIIAAILLTMSAGIWVVTLMSIIALTLVAFRSGANPKLLTTIWIILIIGGIVLSQTPEAQDKISTFTESFSETTLETKLTSWNESIQEFFGRPITGVGPEVTTAYSSTILTILATTGIIGTIAFIAMIAVGISRAVLVFREKSHSAVTISLGLSFIIWVVLGLLYFQTVTSLLIGAVVIGSLAAVTGKIETKPSRKASPIVPVGLVVLSILVIVSISRFQLAERYFTESLSLASGEAVAKVEKAIEYNRFEPTYYIQKSYYLVGYFNEDTDRTNNNEILRQITNSLATAISLNPHDPVAYRTATDTLYQLSTLAPDQGYLTQSLTYAQRLTEVAPDDADAWISLAVLYNQTGQLEKSTEAFRKAVKLEPAYKENIEKFLGESL